MKAMLINLVGDIGLQLAMFMIIKEFWTLEYSSIYSLLVAADRNNLTIICLYNCGCVVNGCNATAAI